MLSVVMINVANRSVIMLSVVAPFYCYVTPTTIGQSEMYLVTGNNSIPWVANKLNKANLIPMSNPLFQLLKIKCVLFSKMWNNLRHDT